MSSVLERISSNKIKHFVIDFFGYCNARCWFCPVKYYDQPRESRVHMPIDLVEHIFQTIDEEKKNGLISPDFTTLATATFSEVLLYKHFEQLLQLAIKYNLKLAIFTHGLNLTKDKVELINRYHNAVFSVIINAPAFEKELWAKRTGLPIEKFDIFMDNLHYANKQMPRTNFGTMLVINGIDETALDSNLVSLGPKFSELNIDLNPVTGERATQVAKAKELFDNFIIDSEQILIDRNEKLSYYISNSQYLTNKKVIGCNAPMTGDRVSEVVHISPNGDLFLCFNDFDLEYKFGNLKEKSLRDIWGSEEHIQVVEKAVKEFCIKCLYAVTE